MKARCNAAPGFRPLPFAIFLSAMAPLAYMPAPACALPVESGPASDPSSGVAPPTGDTPFDRQGMWVWYVDHSEGGDVGRIVARANRAGIGTLHVKAGDGGDYWSQFSSSLVEALHQGGGTVGTTTWPALLGVEPARPTWSPRRARPRRGAGASRLIPASRPASSSLPAKAYEIDPGPAP